MNGADTLLTIYNVHSYKPKLHNSMRPLQADSSLQRRTQRTLHDVTAQLPFPNSIKLCHLIPLTRLGRWPSDAAVPLRCSASSFIIDHFPNLAAPALSLCIACPPGLLNPPQCVESLILSLRARGGSLIASDGAASAWE